MGIIVTGGVKLPQGKFSVGPSNLAPVWQTASGQILSISELTVVNEAVLATDPNDDTVTYSISAGALPGGLSLDVNTGSISGTASDVESTTEFFFTVQASDGKLTTDREFSIEIQDIPSGSEVFNVSGSFTHTVESGVTSIEGKCWGGGGGSGQSGVLSSNRGGHGAGGGYASSVLSVTPGQSVTIKVGGPGIGGDGDAAGGSGAGASDVRLSGVRQIIAAGGGGGGQGTGTSFGGNGGAGGGINGIDGSNSAGNPPKGFGGGGGTQSTGGAGGGSSFGVGDNGSAFQGGGGGDAHTHPTSNPGGFNGGGRGEMGAGAGAGLFGGGGGHESNVGNQPTGGGGGGSSQGTTKTSGGSPNPFNAGNNSDTDYASDAGRGGLWVLNSSNPGNPGRIVINWGPGI